MGPPLSIQIAEGIIQFLQRRHIPIQYGFIAPMEASKTGAVFFSGIGKLCWDVWKKYLGTHIRMHTVKKVKMQRRFEATKLQDKVWTTLWGNIITHRHLGFPTRSLQQIQKSIQELEVAIHPHKATYLDDQTLFFTLPLDVTQFLTQRPAYRTACQRVNQVLKKYQLRTEIVFDPKKDLHLGIPVYPDVNLAELPGKPLRCVDTGLRYFPNEMVRILYAKGASLQEIEQATELIESEVIEENQVFFKEMAAKKKGGKLS